MNYSSITRLTGFASGMDTDSIVKKLMNAESISLNKLKQNQQKQTWLSDTYRQWNADLLAFRSNTVLNMSLSKTYNTFDVTSSQENSVSATASGTSLAGTYSVEVKQLASSAAFTGDKVYYRFATKARTRIRAGARPSKGSTRSRRRTPGSPARIFRSRRRNHSSPQSPSARNHIIQSSRRW